MTSHVSGEIELYDLMSSDSDNDNSYSDEEDYNPKYCLGLCILWCKDIHGYNSNSTPGIDTHWLLHERVTLEEFLNDDLYWIENYRRNIQSYLSMLQSTSDNTLLVGYLYPLLRNYSDIVSRPYNPKIDIVLMEYLPGLEAVAYIKTVWLRLIQKRWKKLYKQRCHVIANRMKIKSLQFKELHGKWPEGLNKLPGIGDIINF
tara:strand:- start:26 stop:631 length:606 start_codon:yes stop_codon:yes gene_type:complete